MFSVLNQLLDDAYFDFSAVLVSVTVHDYLYPGGGLVHSKHCHRTPYNLFLNYTTFQRRNEICILLI